MNSSITGTIFTIMGTIASGIILFWLSAMNAGQISRAVKIDSLTASMAVVQVQIKDALEIRPMLTEILKDHAVMNSKFESLDDKVNSLEASQDGHP